MRIGEFGALSELRIGGEGVAGRHVIGGGNGKRRERDWSWLYGSELEKERVERREERCECLRCVFHMTSIKGVFIVEEGC